MAMLQILQDMEVDTVQSRIINDREGRKIRLYVPAAKRHIVAFIDSN